MRPLTAADHALSRPMSNNQTPPHDPIGISPPTPWTPNRRWILDPQLGGFPYPLTLTATHMTFCSAATVVLVQFGAVARPPAVTVGVFARTIVPIGALFAITLWLGNAAYVYLPVSFIQMLKVALRGWGRRALRMGPKPGWSTSSCAESDHVTKDPANRWCTFGA
jgi:hypothetical protein